MARVTFSFDAWKPGQVAPTTIQLPVVGPETPGDGEN
jgi:hypothetical protein